jgi:hypothetical protein
MKATTATTKNCSSLLADFLKQKYMEALGDIIADIRENFISSHEEGKFQGMPKSIIPPSKSDIQTGFEHIVEQIKNGQHLLSNDTVVIPYGRPLLVGQTFSTEYFERELKPMPGKYLPGIVIALDPKHIEELEDVVHLGKRYVEKLWAEKDFGKRVKVQFMNQNNKIINVIPIIFAWWFAEQLAKEYLKWCKEEQDLADVEVLNQTIAIHQCIENNMPYSTCLTSDTLRRSTGLADFSSIDHDGTNYKKKQRTSN